jgi:hypothetical protein
MELPPLPYVMGNAGDLLKHGILTEFVHWWCEQHPGGERFRFLDPFGGRPWSPSPPPEVVRRLEALAGTSLARAQANGGGKYLGSGHLVLASAEGRAEVLVSDRLPAACRALVASGLRALEAPEFDSRDGYTVLNVSTVADLVLIDPFAEFISRCAKKEVPRIAKAAEKSGVLLFVLDEDASSAQSRDYAELRDRLLPGAFVARAAKLRGQVVRGETKYDAEVVLVPATSSASAFGSQLVPRLETFCEGLSSVLGVPITVRRSVG